MEIAAFVQPDFIVNTVPNLEGQIAGVFAGNWVSAWLDAVKRVEEIFGVEIREEADIVIATAGGYPRDINLYQTGKTMDNAYYAMKKAGSRLSLRSARTSPSRRSFSNGSGIHRSWKWRKRCGKISPSRVGSPSRS